jgi:hypothetical protein
MSLFDEIKSLSGNAVQRTAPSGKLSDRGFSAVLLGVPGTSSEPAWSGFTAVGRP